MNGDGPDRGSGTVLMLGITGVVGALMVAFVLIGSAFVSAHRARAAADMAAVGAARSLQLGGDAARACREADSLARANRARLVRCQADGPDGSIEAAVSTARMVAALGHGEARAQARAGPRG